jgi:hypothetical protein
MDLDGKANLGGWAWIFIIEGLLTIFFSIFVFIFVPNFPAREKGFSEHDQQRLLARLEADKGKDKALKDQPWKRVVFDYKIWLM